MRLRLMRRLRLRLRIIIFSLIFYIIVINPVCGDPPISTTNCVNDGGGASGTGCMAAL